MTVETFSAEIEEALQVYEKYVVCLDRPPQDLAVALTSLLVKAISAYETRAPNLRHGIALDRYITVILSQSDTARPLCGIYLNLHSPYQEQLGAKAAQRPAEPLAGEQAKSEG